MQGGGKWRRYGAWGVKLRSSARRRGPVKDRRGVPTPEWGVENYAVVPESGKKCSEYVCAKTKGRSMRNLRTKIMAGEFPERRHLVFLGTKVSGDWEGVWCCWKGGDVLWWF